MDFNQLRAKHPAFIYESFESRIEQDSLVINFNFKLLPDIYFRPEIIFPNISSDKIKSINPQALENLIFNLGMVDLLSYWKATCSPQIIIKAGTLNEDQIKFWKNLLIKGLGEFFYNNKIDFTKDDLVDIEIDSETVGFSLYKDGLQDRDLVLVGGGKDSAVALEIIAKSNREYSCLSLNPKDSVKQIVKLTGCENPIYIERVIDPKLLELNRAGYLNGHTPFSAYLAFLSVLSGVLYDYKNLIVSNEVSSNEGNINWLNQDINHQYSKTFEFENLFRDYCKKYLSKDSNYFSFLRPLSELQIAKIFSKVDKYHKVFRSCNVGSKSGGVWCGQCPKCISTYLMLYPFLGDKLIEIFNKNLLEDENIIPIIEGLLRLNNVLKPFECVATVQETQVAINMCIEKIKKENSNLPKVLDAVKDHVKNINILDRWNSENNLLDYYKDLLKATL